MIDEKGRLFGKLNIVDLLVILVVLVAVVVLGVKFLGKDGGGGINPGKTQVTYTIDLLFTIECNVVNPVTTEIGTQEVRVGKTHTVKTDKFELMNGVILDCEWGDGAAAADAQ